MHQDMSMAAIFRRVENGTTDVDDAVYLWQWLQQAEFEDVEIIDLYEWIRSDPKRIAQYGGV